MARNKNNRAFPADEKYSIGPYNLEQTALDVFANPKADVEVLIASKTLLETDMNRIYVLNAAAGLTITLPSIDAQNAGMWIQVDVMTSVTSNDYGIDTGATADLFEGHVFITKATDAVANQKYFAADESNDDSLNQNGTTTGGLIGSSLMIIANANGYWTVSGHLNGSGTLATPFV